MNTLNKKLDTLDKKLDTLDKKLDTLDKKLYWINAIANTILEFQSGVRYTSLNFHPERLLGLSLDAIQYSHILRYLWVKNKYGDNNTIGLDVGCGVGYGSNILSNKFKTVYALDNNAILIKNYALRGFNKNNIHYISRDIDTYSADCLFDIITAFEVVEHIKEDKKLIDKLYCLLKNNGHLIISVPNENHIPHNTNNNPYHYKHYTKKDIIELFNPKRWKTNIFYQYKDDILTDESLENHALIIIVDAIKIESE